MLRAGDDFFLHVGVQVDEVVRVAGHPNQKVLMVLGMGLRLPQKVGADDVHLNEEDEVNQWGQRIKEQKFELDL